LGCARVELRMADSRRTRAMTWSARVMSPRRAWSPSSLVRPRAMTWPARVMFNDMVEVVHFDTESGITNPSSSLFVEIAGPHTEKQRSSPAPVTTAPVTRTGSWGSDWSMPVLPETDCSHTSILSSSTDDDDDEQEAAEESAFAKAAQRRRIRRSVTVNFGQGLPPHALKEMTMSRILSRRRESCLSVDTSSSSADDSIDCPQDKRCCPGSADRDHLRGSFSGHQLTLVVVDAGLGEGNNVEDAESDVEDEKKGQEVGRSLSEASTAASESDNAALFVEPKGSRSDSVLGGGACACGGFYRSCRPGAC